MTPEMFFFFSQHLYFKPCGLLTRLPYNTCCTLTRSAGRRFTHLTSISVWSGSQLPAHVALKRGLTKSALLFRPHSLNSSLKLLKRESRYCNALVFSLKVSGSVWGKDILFYLRFRCRFPPFLLACGQKDVRSWGPVRWSAEKQRDEFGPLRFLMVFLPQSLLR